jgi:V8-like Glu-specific endopeptidase
MIDFLRDAARLGVRTGLESLPPDILSFTLEYPSRPDVDFERQRLEQVLDGSGFDLFAYSEDDDPELLILQFQGFRLRQSSGFLFEVADQLASELDLVSVVPEVGPGWVEVETVQDQPEAVGEIVWAACRSDAPVPVNSDWARKMIRADKVESRFSVTGRGVLIGQPDTGVADHVELKEGIDRARGYNFVDNSSDPTDPLASSMSSPGHGTSTSSLVVSRASGLVTGSAPGATLVPIRCINGVVIGLGVAVAKAIDHARKQGCRIATMSLGGGIQGQALKRAIRRAVDADMIVLAAAGNCVGFVVYPAWDENVIAVAGIDQHETPWKGSSRGRKVDVSAPGENVTVARRKPESADTSDINPEGQGTSFAVALTAGCAALWIERFGFDAIVAEARQRDSSVQELFRAAIRATARRPEKWNSDKMGAGIVDAHNLLSTPLDKIPKAKAVTSQSTSELVFGTSSFGRFESEATYLASDQLIRKSDSSILLEGADMPRPSPGFERLLRERNPDALWQPFVATGPVTPFELPQEVIGRISTRSGAFHESIGSWNEVLDQAEAVLAYHEGAQSESVRFGARGEFLAGIEKTLAEIGRKGTQALEGIDLDRDVRLEALVELVGRPALRLCNGETPFDIQHPGIGQWAENLMVSFEDIRELSRTVGRVDIETTNGWQHVGTGFVTGPNQIMTNRHVLDAFAEPFPISPGTFEMRLTANASINFDADAADDKMRYRIKSVISSGRDRIGRFVDLSKLDMAILEIETENGHSNHPNTFSTKWLPTSGVTEVAVFGFPARPGQSAAPQGQSAALEYWQRIREIYQRDFGTKYLSPGEIKFRPSEMGGDKRGWAFSHDATTMGGNSGSVVVSIGDQFGPCGLHFGGRTLARNMAHDLTKIDSSRDLVTQF